LGNPLRYIDPDGHQTTSADALIVFTPETTVQTARVVKDIGAGALKEAANTYIGVGNFTKSYIGGEYTELYQPTNKTQEFTMNTVATVALFAGLMTGKASVGGVAVADAKATTIVAAEAGNATKAASTLKPGPFATESIPARGPQRSFTVSERNAINEIGMNSGCHTCGITTPATRRGNFIPDHQPANALNPTNGPQRLFPHCSQCSHRQGGEVTSAKRFNPGGHKF
jgi:hypothetical protein